MMDEKPIGHKIGIIEVLKTGFEPANSYEKGS